MKYILLMSLLAAAVAVAQQDIHIFGRDARQDGSVTRVSGGATLSSPTIRIQADSITYNRETGEALATGNVHIKFLTKADSRMQPADTQPTMQERIERMRRLSLPEIFDSK
ncbi:MAG TPA: hypothetical protein VGL72_09035 [Bryobacteraceae bacterium]